MSREKGLTKMATATINGKPSVFQSLVTPTEQSPTYPDRVADFTAIATEMAAEAEPKTDADWLNDPKTRAELNAWYDSLDTPEAFEEFDAWVTEQERIAIMSEAEMTAEEEAELCSRYDADAAELASLGCACLIGLNTNHDLIWQQGGSV